MGTYRIDIVNRDFTATSHSELPSREAARKEAMRGALEIGTEEVCGGKSFFGAEVAIELDGKTIDRLVVALGMSSLL